MSDQNCIFCQIVERQIPSAKVYEDEHFLAFLDIAPFAKGHTLIIPKEHVANILEFNPSKAEGLFKVIQKLAPAIMQATKTTGFNLIQNNFASAGQTVFHVHWHIIPRFENDNILPWAQNSYENTEIMAEMAKNILKHL